MTAQPVKRCPLAKQRQAAYYDRGARVRPTLAVGDTVRTRWNNNDEWEKAEVTRVLPHRSYLLRFENGSTRRRTSKHVRFSNEPPLIIRDEIDDGSAATQPLPQPPPRPPNSRNTGHTVTSGVARRAPENTMTATSTAAALVTRSGRQVKRPAKYADYVS
jgi:hypothetical protein